MMPTGASLNRLAANLTPTILSILLVILCTAPLQLPRLEQLGFAAALVSIYFWTLHSPARMPLPAVFLIGLVNDLLGGAPLGVGTLVLLFAARLAVSQSLLFSAGGFLLSWIGFAIFAAAASAGTCAVASALELTLLDPRPELPGYVTALLLYPPLAWLLGWAERGLPRAA